MMAFEQFRSGVRKILSEELFPCDGGKASRLPSEYVDELLIKMNWLGTKTMVEEYFDNRGNYTTDKACIESAANYLWTEDNC